MTHFGNDQQYLHQLVHNCKQKAVLLATGLTSLHEVSTWSSSLVTLLTSMMCWCLRQTTVHSILGNVLWPTNKARLGDPRDSTLVTRLPGRKQG